MQRVQRVVLLCCCRCPNDNATSEERGDRFFLSAKIKAVRHGKTTERRHSQVLSIFGGIEPIFWLRRDASVERWQCWHTFTSASLLLCRNQPHPETHSAHSKHRNSYLTARASLTNITSGPKMATTAPAPEEDKTVAPMCGCFEMCFPKQEEVKEEVVTKDADGDDAAAQDDSTESSAEPSGSEGSTTDEEEASKASKKGKKKTHRVRRWLASRSSVKSKSKKESS